jgi:hypothetical protein
VTNVFSETVRFWLTSHAPTYGLDGPNFPLPHQKQKALSKKLLIFLLFDHGDRGIQLFIDFIFYLSGDFYNLSSKVIISCATSIYLLNIRDQNNKFFFEMDKSHWGRNLKY